MDATALEATEILDRMAVIVSNEMLVHGEYVDSEFLDPQMSDSVCGGHRYCAIGALFAASGIKPERRVRPWGVEFTMPEAENGNRHAALLEDPALLRAYNALNAEADAFIEEKGFTEGLDDTFEASIERLFEGEDPNSDDDDESYFIDRIDLLELINRAKANLA
jgi:hypothetical protein